MYYNDWASDNEAGGERKKRGEKGWQESMSLSAILWEIRNGKERNKNLFTILLPEDFLSF